MPRMTSDLTETKPYPRIPKDIYPGHIDTLTVEVSKETQNKPDSEKTRMLNITWAIDATKDSSGADLPPNPKIPFDNVVISGLIRKPGPNLGRPIPLFRLAKLIEVCQVPWKCSNCNTGPRVAKFHYGRGEDGLLKGQIACPDCRQPIRMEYDTDDFQGKRAKLAVDIEPIPGKDQDKNVVKDYAPIDA